MAFRDETVSFSLELNVQKAEQNIRRFETVLYRTMGLMREMGLPPNIDEAMRKVQAGITLMNQYRLVAIQAQAVSGPLGWTLLGISALTTVFATREFMESELRGR